MPTEVVDTIVLPPAIESNVLLTKISRISVTEEDHNVENDDTSLCKEESASTSVTFYTDAQRYWHGIAPTIDGMLGGFGNINITDIRGSNEFLQQVFKMKPAPGRRIALDCKLLCMYIKQT